MSNKLKKVILGPDWIDLSYGEPELVMSTVFKQLNRAGSSFKMPDLYRLPKWTYQPAVGNPEFVKLLENKYNAKVVVCNGAKQALTASLHAFTKVGVSEIYFSSPHYPPSPAILRNVNINRSYEPNADAILLTSPNNPDGANLTNDELLALSKDRYAIHDGAYYTPTYLPEGQTPIKVGDIQIFSMSKMYGLSGLRIGYAVCHNERFYENVIDYVELATAGVSIASQEIALSIEKFFLEHPARLDEFQTEVRASLKENREILKGIDPDVLEILPCDSNSMFAWAKIGPALDYKAAKVYILEGTLFGQPGMMRINIAYQPEVLREAVKRLNSHKIRN